jgi:micrococcal nuclease
MRVLALNFLIAVSLPASANGEEWSGPVPTHYDRYTYLAKIVRVIDGDTVVANIDLGFNTWRMDERLRLARIDAPEVQGAERSLGLSAALWLRTQIDDKWLIIRTVADRKGRDRKGSFGRYLVEIFFQGKNINDELVKRGFAKYKNYN